MKHKFIQVVLLICLIVLPVMIFVFLKSFGENQYVVTSYYQDNIADSVLRYCPEIEAPHKVEISSKSKDELFVVLPLMDTVLNSSTKNILNRVELRYPNEVDIFLFLKQGVHIDSFYSQVSYAEKVWEDYVGCHLLTDAQNPAMVLVDSEGVIRGYYDYKETKEIDRLLIEIAIIRKNNNG